MLEMEVIGNLGKDCTVNNVNGKNVINFSVADSKKDKNGETKTTWIDCSYWSEKTGVALYLKKGTKVFAKGEPSIRSYTKADGSAGVSFQLSVFKIELLSVAGDGVSPQQQQTRRTETIVVDENPDLPF
jgi:single-strand DNA-binding protein